MRNTGQIEAKIEERIKEAKDKQILQKIRNVLGELYDAKLVVPTGNATKFEYSSPTVPKIHIDICSTRLDLYFKFNSTIVFSFHDPIQSNEKSITGYIPGDWEKLLEKGAILKLIRSETERARVEGLRQRRLNEEKMEQERKAAPPSIELRAKAAQFGVELDLYDPAG